jgi:transposase
MSKDAFTADAWDVVGRKVAKERLLADIYETSKVSVGLPVALDSDAISMFRLVLGEGRSLIAQRNQIEDRAVALLKDLPDYQLLTSIPGIGPINALTILAEAGDLRRFVHHRQFLKFCGMDFPWPNQAIKIRKCPSAPHPLDGWTGSHSATRQQLPRQV